MPQEGKTISAAEFEKLYGSTSLPTADSQKVGMTLSAEDFQKRYGQKETGFFEGVGQVVKGNVKNIIQEFPQAVRTPLAPISKLVPDAPEGLPAPYAALAGVGKAGVELIEGLTTPENIALGAVMAKAPVTIARMGSAAFSALMASQLPDMWQQFKEAKTVSEKARIATNALGTAAFSALAGKHALTKPKAVDVAKPEVKPVETKPVEKVVAEKTVKQKVEVPPQQQPQPSTPAPEVAAAPIDFGSANKIFTTEKGSTYTVSGQSTQRTKTKHEGHLPTDVGLKEPSERTIYLNDNDATKIGMHGTLSGKKALIVKDGKVYPVSWNEAAGKWGIAPSNKDGYAFTESPEIGKSPLELWKGEEGGEFGSWHSGNKITKIEQVSTPPEKQFGAANKIFTKDVVDKAFENIRSRATKPEFQSGGLKDIPANFKDWVDIAGYYVEGGIRRWPDFQKKMIEEFGDAIKPHLLRIWNDVQDKFAANVRLGKFSEESKTALKDIAVNQSFTELEAQRRGIRSQDETVAAALKQGDIVRQAKAGEIKPGKAFNAEELEAMAIELDSMARLQKEGVVKNPEVAQATINLFKTYAGGVAEAGRSLNILGKISDSRQVESIFALKNMIDDPRTKSMFEAMESEFKKKGKIDPTWFDKVLEFARNVKLASPGSLVKSTIGNAGHQMILYADRATSTAMNKAVSFMTGKSQDRFAGEIAAQFMGQTAGAKRGLKDAVNILRENDQAVSAFLQSEVGGMRAIEGAKGKAIRAPQNAQGAVDAVFRVPYFEGLKKSYALREAFKEGLKGDEAILRARELEGSRAIEEMAKKDAEYATFQEELGFLGKKVNEIRKGFKPIQLVVPFFNTAANLFKVFTKHTPLAFLYKDVRRGIIDGLKKGGELGKATDKLAPVVNGTLGGFVVLSAVNEVLNGNVSGRGSKSKLERDAMLAAGWQPYSFKVGDKWVSYRGFEPMSSWMGVLADWNEGHQDEGLSEKVYRSTFGMVRGFLDNPFMTGIKDVYTTLAEAEERTPSKFLANIAVGMTIPTILKQTGNIIDPIIRDVDKSGGVKETVEQYLRSVPIAKENLPAKVDIFGEDVKMQYPASRLAGLIISKASEDVVRKEMARLAKAGYRTSGTGSSYEGIKLTNEQKNQLRKVAGEGVKSALNDFFSSPEYQNMTIEEQGTEMRAIVQDIYSAQKEYLFWRLKEAQGE